MSLHVLLQNDRCQLRREAAEWRSRRGSSRRDRARPATHCSFSESGTKPSAIYKWRQSVWTHLTDCQCPLGVHGQLCQVNTKFWKRKFYCESTSTQESHSDLLSSEPDTNRKGCRKQRGLWPLRVPVTARTSPLRARAWVACRDGCPRREEQHLSLPAATAQHPPAAFPSKVANPPLRPRNLVSN